MLKKKLKKFTSGRIQTFSLFIFALLLAGCQKPVPEPLSAGAIPAIDSLVTAEVQQGHIPGAVVRVEQDDSVLHFKAYGFAQKYEYGPKLMKQPDSMTTRHLFDLASLTKVFATTFGIMMLTDEGKLSPDDSLHTWFPEFNTGEKRKITIRHLLRHSAGLYPWKPTYYYASDPKERFNYVSKLPLRYPVGEGRHYSDLGFMLLGDIIQRVSGKPLDVYLQEELFAPLGLENTFFNPLKQGIAEKQIAATSHGNPFEKQMVYDDDFGYNVDADPESWDGWRLYTLRGEVNDGNAWYANQAVAGHAGLFSTASELQVLVNLLLEKGRSRGEQIISEAVIDTFLTKGPFGNGLGWAMDPTIFYAEGVPEGSFGHTGFTGTSVVVVPEYHLSIILFTNRQNVGRQKNGYYFDLGPLRQAIVDEVLAGVRG